MFCRLEFEFDGNKREALRLLEEWLDCRIRIVEVNGHDENSGSLSVQGELAVPPSSAEALRGAWNELKAPGQPTWLPTKSRGHRYAAALARLKERPLEEWKIIIRRIAASSFCRGANERKWVATPDFLLRPDTATKALEGQYDDRAENPTCPGKPPGWTPPRTLAIATEGLAIGMPIPATRTGLP